MEKYERKGDTFFLTIGILIFILFLWRYSSSAPSDTSAQIPATTQDSQSASIYQIPEETEYGKAIDINNYDSSRYIVVKYKNGFGQITLIRYITENNKPPIRRQVYTTTN